jgi:hypothetical protein
LVQHALAPASGAWKSVSSVAPEISLVHPRSAYDKDRADIQARCDDTG